MKMLYPLVTADIALFTLLDFQLRVLLIKRGNVPALGEWALPGGILKPNEDASLDDTARRVLRGKIQVDVPHLVQVTTTSGAQRDPRGWSISTLYFAFLPYDKVPAVAGDTIEDVAWCDPGALTYHLAFDHGVLLEKALAMLRQRISQGALPLHVLPQKFTLTVLQRACEAILGRPLDKGAFRRLMKEEQALQVIPDEFVRGPQRPAQLYQAVSDFRF